MAGYWSQRLVWSIGVGSRQEGSGPRSEKVSLAGVDTKRRILIAEDDPATLALLTRQLERAGYAVTGCANGREALDRLREWGADIVLADWSMPEMTGVDLCRAMTEQRDTLADQPVYTILLTAYGDKARVVEGLEAGADDFLSKPYDLPELLARIRAGERILDLQHQLHERQVELSRAAARLSQLNRRLSELASTDDLTKLPNRRYVLEHLHTVWALAGRHNRPLSCIMLDIDHFKRVNDTHGHRAGDGILEEVAAIMRECLRRGDICGRFGGEEFLVVCQETGVRGAAALAERIRAGVAQREMRAPAGAVTVTASLGVAALRGEHASPDALLAEADTALYAAKQHGRNCVWYADEAGQLRAWGDAAAAACAAGAVAGRFPPGGGGVQCGHAHSDHERRRDSRPGD